MQLFGCLKRHVVGSCTALEPGNRLERAAARQGTSGPRRDHPASLDASLAPKPQTPSERIAEEALAEALRRLCRGGSWQGVTRELAWRAVTGGHRDPRSVEPLAETAEAMLAPLIDEALWEVEQRVVASRDEYLEERPRDEAGSARRRPARRRRGGRAARRRGLRPGARLAPLAEPPRRVTAHPFQRLRATDGSGTDPRGRCEHRNAQGRWAAATIRSPMHPSSSGRPAALVNGSCCSSSRRETPAQHA